MRQSSNTPLPTTLPLQTLRERMKSTNSTCRDVGHDWKTTATANYRLCQRHKCGAAQRLQDGVWINAVPERPWTDPVVAYHKKLAMPRQNSLF